ncbi:YT521-B-like domain-containing protein [Lyophyllum atratum]|nr:YT521-B-like domain-containing protein [Lyophyllum atratum]
MVESILGDDPILRGTTPTPTLHHFVDNLDAEREPSGDLKDLPSGSPAVYDTSPSDISPAPEADSLSGGLEGAGGSLFGDAREGKPVTSLSMPDQPRSSRRRSPRSHSTSRHRPPLPRPVQSPPSSYGPTPETVHNIGSSSGFQPPPVHYTSPPLPYDQRTGYGQYTMSPQSPMSMDHIPPTFAYPNPYHHPGMPDSNMMTRNIHANYQPMLQPPAPTFQYQNRSPDGTSSAHHPYSAAGPSSMYGHLQANPSPPIHSPAAPTTTPQSPSHSPYTGTSGFHSLGYSTPMSTPPYAYPSHQAYSASPPMYSQYAPAPYAQHFSPSLETERQGTWWYMPHSGAVSPQQQFDNGPAYQNHYPLSYSMHHADAEPYSPQIASSPTSPAAAYPMSPIRPTSPDSRPTSTSSVSGIVPPLETNTRPSSSEKLAVRRSYHPNPPAHRSEWVMWVGNVPSDATHDELWRFFNQPEESGLEPSPSTGVLSIFLISRSSCAFVNFESEHHLTAAIERFSGQSLRPQDARCPRLVCRVRKKDDDLKAGVGGQRGIGIHTRWIKEQKEKVLQSSDASDLSTSDDVPSTGSDGQMAVTLSSWSFSSDEDPRQRRNAKHSSSSGSYTSTNSSLLTRFFPQRYFILKSLTQYDLDLSVEKGLWATQKHNEGILDQAFRTSQDVYLIFSVNKSGEFYGYAKMSGPIRRGEQRVSWATRTTDSSASSRSSLSPVAGRGIVHSPTIPEEHESPSRLTQLKGNQGSMFFSPGANRQVDQSPLPVSGGGPQQNPPTSFHPHVRQSAPAELGAGRQKMTMLTPAMMYSLDQRLFRGNAPDGEGNPERSSNDQFELDPMAPMRAIRSGSGSSGDSHGQEQGTSGRTGSMLHMVAEEEEKGEEEEEDGHAEIDEEKGQKGKEPAVADGEVKDGGREEWGESFKIEWLSTEKLPFHRTRHIRNPWNHDREVKVSRDGTELEPGVGRRLLEEWTRLSEVPSVTTQAGKVPATSRRGSKSAPSSVAAIPT